MADIVIQGLGAVSPAGWGVPPLAHAIAHRPSLPIATVPGPTPNRTYTLRKVPAPPSRPAFLSQPRLRRSSVISHFTLAAALEALGSPSPPHPSPASRVGIVFCTMTGSVIYSRRFYEEVLREPATASPLLFPETVYNAPASHLAAVLGTTGRVHTEVGDATCFLKGLHTASLWLEIQAVDRCLVIAAEEGDWLSADGYSYLSRPGTASEGAGALLLARHDGSPCLARLAHLTDPIAYSARLSPHQAATAMRQALAATPKPVPPESTLLVDAIGSSHRLDRAERAAWSDWTGPRLSPKSTLGEAWAAGAAWQCVAAIQALSPTPPLPLPLPLPSLQRALVSVLGTQESAMGIAFDPPPPTPSIA